jgi:hypothetical protein
LDISVPASGASPAVDALAVSRGILRLVTALNYAMGAGILVLFIATLVAKDFTMTALGVSRMAGSDGPILEMRLIMVFGILAVPLLANVLKQLLAIVDTVRSGNPFVSENAGRLQTIAWSVLGLEVVHVIIGLIVRGVAFNGQPINIGWELSGTRWLSIPLLFVLAKVFAEGARMRDDLDGTV